VPAAALAQVPAEFDKAELDSWSTVSRDAVRAAAPSQARGADVETQPFWARPSVPLGFHRPVWPARGSA
jgi:hypothetical protein